MAWAQGFAQRPNIKNHDELARLSHHFMVLLKGLLNFLIDLPGTGYNNDTHVANAIRKPLDGVLKQFKFALEEGKASPEQDLLSFLLSNVGEKGESLTQVEIKDNIFCFSLQFMTKAA